MSTLPNFFRYGLVGVIAGMDGMCVIPNKEKYLKMHIFDIFIPKGPLFEETLFSSRKPYSHKASVASQFRKARGFS